jgi:hypothetical protein
MRRAGLLLGVAGGILCGFLEFSDAQGVWNQLAAHRRFESLMAAPIMQKVAKAARDYQREVPAEYQMAGGLAEYDASAGKIGPRRDADQYRQVFQQIQQARSSGTSDDDIRYGLVLAGYTKDEIAALLPQRGLRPVHVRIVVGGIAGAWVDEAGLVTSVEPSPGTPVERTEAPSFKAWCRVLLYPILGFLLPWGGIRALTWVGTGFSEPPRRGEIIMGSKDYRVFSALHEDTDKGWVWSLLDGAEGLASRTTIKISRGCRSVYCE